MKNYGNSQNVGSDNRRCMLSAGRGDRHGMDPGLYPLEKTGIAICMPDII